MREHRRNVTGLIFHFVLVPCLAIDVVAFERPQSRDPAIKEIVDFLPRPTAPLVDIDAEGLAGLVLAVEQPVQELLLVVEAHLLQSPLAAEVFEQLSPDGFRFLLDAGQVGHGAQPGLETSNERIQHPSLFGMQREHSSIVSGAAGSLWSFVWEQCVCSCARHRVKFKPGRQSSRNRQQYRRKSRGLQAKLIGRKRSSKPPRPQMPGPEILSDRRGRMFLLG